MSLKTTVKYLQSGEISSPASSISGANLASGNLSSNFLPMNLPMPDLTGSATSPLNLINAGLNNTALGAISNVGNINSLPGGGGGIIGGIGGIGGLTGGLDAIGGGIGGSINGIVPNLGDMAGSIGGSLTGAINGSIGSIGSTLNTNLNAISSSINGIKQDIGNTVSAFNNVASAVKSGDIGKLVSTVLPSLSFNTRPNTNMSIYYPETLKNVALNPAHIHFQFFRQNTQTKLSSIHLPMPDDIRNPSTINWEATDFGMMGNAAVKSIQAVKSDNVSKSAITDQLNSMSERVKSVAFYHAASEVVNGLGGNQLSPDDIMGATSGKVTNPYKTFLFRGVNFRTFSFNFNLVPFSEADCDSIDKIVSKFREHSYPDFASDKMFFTYPDECQITYMWESSHNKWLNSFKRAVCSSVEANFAPLGQWAALRNGFPYMITLSTIWTEVEIITKGDISSKNNQGQRG